MSDTDAKQAVERHGWWPGWIWSIPIAALGLVLWLVIRGMTQAGPEVTVIFPEVADLKPGDTTVQFEGMEVGRVEESHLEPDLLHVRAKLSLNTDMRGKLGPGTAFWIIGKTVSVSHLSDLRALFAGVSIGIQPKPGHTQNVYHALAKAPVLGFGAEGTTFQLHAAELGSIQPNTPIYYLGQQVGKVESYAMKDARGFDITAFVDAPYDRFVHTDSRFWRAGPLHITTGGNGPSVAFQSIPALFEGAIAFETPSGDKGPVGHDFTLYSSKDAAENSPDGDGVTYRVVFQDASGVPGKEAPVTLMGKRVGSVSSTSLQYDPEKGRMSVIATIMLEPDRIDLPDGMKWNDPRAQMDDMMRHLVANGLRAELSASPPVIGGQTVSLQIVPGDAGALGSGTIPEIPTQEGGGMSGIMASVNDIVAKVDQMPLPAIADNLRDISHHVSQLSGSPELASTLRQIDEATAHLQHVTGEVQAELPATLTDLRRTVAEAQESLASAKTLLSAQGGTASGPGTEGLPQTLYEISRTARSLRGLSDMLSEHPQVLLTGKSANQ